MPKLKPYLNKIPAFYRKQTIDVLLFAHVNALWHKGMQIKDAVEDFRQVYGLNEDNFPMDSALVAFSQMRNSFLWNDVKRGKQ